MNFSRYISTNVLSLFGNIIFISLLCVLYLMANPELSFSKSSLIKTLYNAIFYLGEICINLYMYIFSFLFLLILIEVLIHKITNYKFILKVPFKNKITKQIYNILFYSGFISSVLFLFLYIIFLFLAN